MRSFSEAVAATAVRLYDLHPADRLYQDVRAGLSAWPRKLPPKYFYDERGAELFVRITHLDAYYLTRTELSILERCVDEIAAAIGPHARVLELGSGSGAKTRWLLRALDRPVAYLPVDVCRGQLRRLAVSLRREFPGLEVQPVCADYAADWSLPPSSAPLARTLAFFPGSSIGNFEEAEARALLARLRRLCGPGGALLLGTDLHKERALLERAYDDPEGVTAAFNLNLLRRLNRECGTDFDTAAFRHHAFYDEPRRRIEMRLVATRPTVVSLPGRGAQAQARFHFATGDFVTTEYSHKYTPASLGALASAAGWVPERSWTDECGWFAVWLLRAMS